MKNYVTASILIVSIIICLSFLSQVSEVFSYIRTALILILLLVGLPMGIYRFNTKRRKKITQRMNSWLSSFYVLWNVYEWVKSQETIPDALASAC